MVVVGCFSNLLKSNGGTGAVHALSEDARETLFTGEFLGRLLRETVDPGARSRFVKEAFSSSGVSSIFDPPFNILKNPLEGFLFLMKDDLDFNVAS